MAWTASARASGANAASVAGWIVYGLCSVSGHRTGELANCDGGGGRPFGNALEKHTAPPTGATVRACHPGFRPRAADLLDSSLWRSRSLGMVARSLATQCARRGRDPAN